MKHFSIFLLVSLSIGCLIAGGEGAEVKDAMKQRSFHNTANVQMSNSMEKKAAAKKMLKLKMKPQAEPMHENNERVSVQFGDENYNVDTVAASGATGSEDVESPTGAEEKKDSSTAPEATGSEEIRDIATDSGATRAEETKDSEPESEATGAEEAKDTSTAIGSEDTTGTSTAAGATENKDSATASGATGAEESQEDSSLEDSSTAIEATGAEKSETAAEATGGERSATAVEATGVADDIKDSGTAAEATGGERSATAVEATGVADDRRTESEATENDDTSKSVMFDATVSMYQMSERSSIDVQVTKSVFECWAKNNWDEAKCDGFKYMCPTYTGDPLDRRTDILTTSTLNSPKPGSGIYGSVNPAVDTDIIKDVLELHREGNQNEVSDEAIDMKKRIHELENKLNENRDVPTDEICNDKKLKKLYSKGVKNLCTVCKKLESDTLHFYLRRGTVAHASNERTEDVINCQCMHTWLYEGKEYFGCDKRMPDHEKTWCYTNGKCSVNKKGGWRLCRSPDAIDEYLNKDTMEMDPTMTSLAEMDEHYSVSDEDTEHSKIMMWQARLLDKGLYHGKINGKVTDDFKVAARKEIKKMKKDMLHTMFQSLKHQFSGFAIDGHLHGNPISSREDFEQLNAALCTCGKVLKVYEQKNCKTVFGNQLKIRGGIKKLDKCYQYFSELSQTSPACVCPVNPSIGPCGVPVHLDLYTGKKKNVIDIELPKACENVNVVGSDVSIQGLEGHKDLKTFLLDTVKNHLKFEDKKVSWKNVIPSMFGQILRDNCKALEWSVNIGHGALVIDVKGLSIKVSGTCQTGKNKGKSGRRLLETSRRNRRLLQYAQVKGC